MANDKTVLYIVAGVLIYFALFSGANTGANNGVNPNANTLGNPNGVVQCNVQPGYTYSSIDFFQKSTAVGTGTQYIKANGNAAVTTLTNPTFGHDLIFWNGNSSYFCNQIKDTAKCGPNLMQSTCIQNGTWTLAGADMTTSPGSSIGLTTTAGAAVTNLSTSAGVAKTVDITITGVPKKAVMPFGGCGVIEYSPANITTLNNVQGSDIDVTKPCPYTYTYSTNVAGNVYKMFAIPDGFDVGADANTGAVKHLKFQIQPTSNKPVGIVYITMQQAQDYITIQGDFARGVEKDKNSDTTKVASSVVTGFQMV